jgi:hypothetical protein
LYLVFEYDYIFFYFLSSMNMTTLCEDNLWEKEYKIIKWSTWAVLYSVQLVIRSLS